MPGPSLRYVTIAVVALPLATITAFKPGAAEQTSSLPGSKALLQVPVSPLFPGGVTYPPPIANPYAGDPAAIQRGMQVFVSMNCVGCHAPNGGGGMGPALSERQFIYGREPANIYLSIEQGRPNGMPAWGILLPANAIWDLVAYITSISSAPETGWGETISRSPPSPGIQQVPAELVTTATPWADTEPFGDGRKPTSMGTAAAPASAVAALPPAAAAPLGAGDAAAGEQIFTTTCSVCHSSEPGVNKVGPSLAGIVGSKSGAAPRYSFSAALKAANITWDEQTLDKFLENPSADVHGTRMPISVPNPEDRHNVIAYLKTLKP
jgi:cytochrome c oxidase cbb3-type subunit 3